MGMVAAVGGPDSSGDGCLFTVPTNRSHCQIACPHRWGRYLQWRQATGAQHSQL